MESARGEGFGRARESNTDGLYAMRFWAPLLSPEVENSDGQDTTITVDVSKSGTRTTTTWGRTFVSAWSRFQSGSEQVAH